jgi:hypothetical protein
MLNRDSMLKLATINVIPVERHNAELEQMPTVLMVSLLASLT